MMNNIFELDFIVRAILAGLLVALVAGPLGSIIVWKRMSYFGDTLAHSTLLGVSVAFVFNINIYLGLILVCAIISFFLVQLTSTRISSDTVLGILSHTTLAIGLIAITSLKNIRVDLLGYLYGDILSVSTIDLLYILIINFLVFIVLILYWKKILSVIINKELAHIEGVNVAQINLIVVLLMAGVFAIAMKLIGALMITALMVIPAAAARQIAKSPLGMAVFASIIGIVSVLLGVIGSIYVDLPTGPLIVMSSTGMFLLFSFLNIIYKQ